MRRSRFWIGRAGIVLLGLSCAAVERTLAAPPLEDMQERVVKLYGAGGLRGFASYQTGVVVSAEGLIVTGDSPALDPGAVAAVFSDGERRSARLVGTDPVTGVALLKTEPPLRSAAWFDLSTGIQPQAGDSVLVLANLFGIAAGDEPVSLLGACVSGPATRVAGAPQRYWLDGLEPNPGALGGMVTDARGAPIGLLCRAEPTAGAEGADALVALAAADAAQIIERIVAGRSAAELSQQRDSGRFDPLPILGFAMIPNLERRTPPYIDYVHPRSPAAAAGLKAGDLIVELSGAPVSSQRDLLAKLTVADSEQYEVGVFRAGRLVSVMITTPKEGP